MGMDYLPGYGIPNVRRRGTVQRSRQEANDKSGLDKIAIQVHGLNELIKELNELPRTVRKRILLKTVRAGGAQTLQRVKTLAPKGKTGLFRRSLTKKEKIYPSGAVVSVIGQKRSSSFSEKTKKAARKRAKGSGGISGTGELVPIHLINNPTRPHRIKGSRRGLFKRLFQQAWNRRNVAANHPIVFRVSGSRKPIFRQYANHPGTLGKRFMELAAADMSGTERAMRSKMQEEMGREIAKLASKVNRAGGK